MIVLNFSHPLSPVHLAAVEQMTEQQVERVVDVKTQFDHEQPFAEQIGMLVKSAGLMAEEWQTTPLLVNLPSLNLIAALLLAELHGRCGYFPAILRLKPLPKTTPMQFQVAEVLNLQAIREKARLSR